MKHPVITVKPHDSVAHAREVLEKHRVNQLPVLVDGGLVGIVTDRDLRDAFPSVFEATAPQRRRRPEGDPEQIHVSEVMTPNVLTVAPDARVAEAALTMRRERIGALPVVDRGRLVGIITRSNLLDALVALTASP